MKNNLIIKEHLSKGTNNEFFNSRIHHLVSFFSDDPYHWKIRSKVILIST
jgi:hypothetical protein